MSKATMKKKERNRNTIYLDDFCSEHTLNMEFMTPYQIRISKEKTLIDIYPTSKKFFILKLKGSNHCVWGKYEDLNELLKYFS